MTPCICDNKDRLVLFGSVNVHWRIEFFGCSSRSTLENSRCSRGDFTIIHNEPFDIPWHVRIRFLFCQLIRSVFVNRSFFVWAVRPTLGCGIVIVGRLSDL